MVFKLLSTRYSDNGINVISDVEISKGVITIKNNKTKNKIYHLRLDYNEICSAWKTMEVFLYELLPNINEDFVFIISGEDLTFPQQIDPRWQKKEHKDLIKNVYYSLISHKNLKMCFIENMDSICDKTFPLPLGLNPREFPSNNIDYIINYMNKIPPIKNRDLKTICIHRNRHGDRIKINSVKRYWGKNIISNGNYSKDSWWKLLQTYPFIICSHGGGLDPCPKVWEALCVGCIPIIKHSTMDQVYSEFPIVFVNDWDENTISENNMKIWLKKYASLFDDKNEKNKWIYKLYLEYWCDKIKSFV